MDRLVFLAVPPVMPHDLAMAQTILGAARNGDGPAYDVSVCTPVPGPVTTYQGPDLLITNGLEQAESAATLLVVGGGANPGLDARVPRLLQAAAGSGSPTKRIGALCTGTFVLAHAGLLSGRRATTHWALTDELAARFPSISVVRDAIYVEDGPILTSAGAGAAIEMSLHMIRSDLGSAAAAQAAQMTIAGPPRHADQPQVRATPVPEHTERSLSDTRAWALRRLDQPLTLADLAAHASISPRTLHRQFQNETGLSPLRWLLHHRLDQARRLLETTDLPMDRVASHSGLGSADSLRQHFVRSVGMTPSKYRAAQRQAHKDHGGRITLG
jgi:transcriptional regulator GlxA family with amidase domain